MDTKILMNRTFKKNLQCWLRAAVKQDHRIKHLFSGFPGSNSATAGCRSASCSQALRYQCCMAAWWPHTQDSTLADVDEWWINWLHWPTVPSPASVAKRFLITLTLRQEPGQKQTGNQPQWNAVLFFFPPCDDYAHLEDNSFIHVAG